MPLILHATALLYGSGEQAQQHQGFPPPGEAQVRWWTSERAYSMIVHAVLTEAPLCRDSRNPSSWKEPKVTRSKDEALTKIQGFRTQLEQGTDFAQLASKESHCSSAKRGGDLGKFGPCQMQPAFEDAAYALKVRNHV